MLQSMGSQRVGHDWATELTDLVLQVRKQLQVGSSLVGQDMQPQDGRAGCVPFERETTPLDLPQATGPGSSR